MMGATLLMLGILRYELDEWDEWLEGFLGLGVRYILLLLLLLLFGDVGVNAPTLPVGYISYYLDLPYVEITCLRGYLFWLIGWVFVEL